MLSVLEEARNIDEENIQILDEFGKYFHQQIEEVTDKILSISMLSSMNDLKQDINHIKCIFRRMSASFLRKEEIDQAAGPLKGKEQTMIFYYMQTFYCLTY